MWALFFGAVIIAVIVLYVPGMLAVRGMGASWLVALCAAPAVSLVGYCVLGIVYNRVGISCSWATVLVPWLIVCTVILCAGHLRRARSVRRDVPSYLSVEAPARTALLYAVVGLAVGLAVFVCNLDTPYSFLQEYDNGFHLNVLRSFADSGSWSCLDVSKYLANGDASISPLPAGGFYPAGWHVTGALIISLSSLSPELVENALNYTFSSFVFPLSMFVLMAAVFRERTSIVAAGSVATMAFAAFPWGIITWGPLFPNMAADAVLPGVAAVFVLGWNRLCSLRRGSGAGLPWAAILLVIVGALALGLLQPNAVFFALVLLTPYAAYRLALRSVPRDGAPRARDIVAAAALVLVVIAFWTALYASPVMANVFGDTWPRYASKSQALMDVLTVGVVGFPMQLFVAVPIVLGAVYALRHREYAWIVLAYAIVCAMYFFDVSTDGTIKRFLTGFWYSDSHRIAACMAIVGAPMMAMGLEQISEWIAAIARKLRGRQVSLVGIGCVVAALFAVANAMAPAPSVNEQPPTTALQTAGVWLRDGNDLSDYQHMYSSDEQRFVDEVEDVVPDDALVVNVPDDGSGFAYGANGLRVYYRDFRTYRNTNDPRTENEVPESSESVLIRTELDEVSSNVDVQEALRAIGAEYLLLLDEGDMDDQRHLITYNETLWTGITDISDATPGFEVVLSEGDMRLYRIEAVSVD